MKVAFVLPYLEKPGGWRSFCMGAINALRSYVDPVLFVAQTDASAARELFNQDTIYTLPVTQQAYFDRVRNWGALAQCYWKLKHDEIPKVDLVHALEAYPTGLIGNWLAKRAGCPQVITAHGTYAILWHHHWLDRWLYRGLLQRVDGICPVSEGTATLMSKYFPSDIKPSRMTPILNGNDYHAKVAYQVASLRTFPADPILLTVGDIKARKGQMTSLKAFARLKDQFPRARYWFVGHYKENEYFLQMRQFIDRYNLSDVEFFGQVSQQKLDELYRQASLFVLASHGEDKTKGLHVEGFGLVFLEAGAYGLPVIGTRTGGIPDAVREGETGLLVEPDDVDALAQAMLQLAEQPELSKKMGLTNRRWSETLTWQRYAAEQYQVYQNLLDKR
jgi:phosphatidylinositol alpha-1,6-mannosyltransferase